MSRPQRNGLIVALIMGMVVAGLILALWPGDDQPPQPGPSERATRQQVRQEALLPHDLRTIPQDLAPLARAFTASLSGDQEQQLRSRFQTQHFAPWTATAPRFTAASVEERNQQLAAGTWYGENRQQVEPERLRQVVNLTDWERFPTMDQAGVVIKPALLRVLPTIRPLYEAPDDFPFDHLQFAEIKPQEPVRILHASRDGAWLYIETSTVNGWVEPEAVALADATVRQRLTQAEHLVIVRDFATVRTMPGRTLAQTKIGTLYPLVAQEADHWVVDAAVAGVDQQATFTRAYIAKDDARRHPLAFTPENLTLIGNELLKTPYGWGEVFRNRDCSATTRDFFLAFGLWLPRNSHQQINAGPFLPLAGLSGNDKLRTIRDQGIPFRTLLYLPGHIMLYVGLAKGTPLVFHTTWGLRYTPADGPENKYIIGRTVVSSLELGKEWPLTKGTLLKRLEGMLPLPVVETATGGGQLPGGKEEAPPAP